MPALVAVGAGEAVSQNSAAEITPKGLLDIGWGGFIARLIGERQPGFEVRLDGAIPEGCLGTAALVALGLRCDGFGCGIHGKPHWAWMAASQRMNVLALIIA
ncbi:MAG: hypothetical protein Q8O64_09490 [Sideroxyarcus sp.]|nr:hypothetical protein [Sideroxyarcus sp.]